MDENPRRDLVRSLTWACLEALRPEGLASFDEDFYAAVLASEASGVGERITALSSARPLDATLVAGMFFQVLLQAEELPVGPSDRVSFIRTKAKEYLVDHLSGQISLSQFFRLLDLIEENAHRFFSQARRGWLAPPAQGGRTAAPSSGDEDVRGDELVRALENLPITRKGRRKLTTTGLQDFLRQSAGAWFRLRDFEERFGVNKKTAWIYLDLLLKQGILEHNGERANRVRYTLAGRFRRTGALPPAEAHFHQEQAGPPTMPG
ncbi:MAG: hypothetical protein FJ128_04835 [Deltaproteobacteria bacterium]|nr:hypothetical protein [Deltaproteobacteria bacterium]